MVKGVNFFRSSGHHAAGTSRSEPEARSSSQTDTDYRNFIDSFKAFTEAIQDKRDGVAPFLKSEGKKPPFNSPEFKKVFYLFEEAKSRSRIVKNDANRLISEVESGKRPLDAETQSKCLTLFHHFIHAKKDWDNAVASYHEELNNVGNAYDSNKKVGNDYDSN